LFRGNNFNDMNTRKQGAPIGNRNAAKADDEKQTGKGRVVVDLGDWKSAMVADLEKGQSLKEWLVDAIKLKLDRR